MKGVVFTEFLEMVESSFSARMVDDIIEDAQPASGGAYTAVGTYSHEEMVDMVGALSKRSGMGVPALLHTFGHHLFGRFAASHPTFFAGTTGAMQFLAGIEDIIHAEVLKLYPDAQLPRFEVEHHDPQRLVLLYRSSRHFEDLAEGLIRGCVDHFGEALTVQRELVTRDGDKLERFIITRTPDNA